MSQPRPRIEEIDRNFKGQTSADTLVWIDAFDPRLAIRGLGWPAEARENRSFFRFPARLAEGMPPNVQALAQCPAGVFIAFRSDAADLSVRLANVDTGGMNHMAISGSAGAELYMQEEGRWYPVGTAIPGNEHRCFERVLTQGRPRHLREFRLYLPLYKATEQVEIGFSPEAVVEPSPAPEGSRPTVFYGTSITQGGCASTTGSDFVSIVARMLGIETLNFGFSGNGKGEAVLAEALAGIDAEMFVLDYVANAALDLLDATLPEFIRILRTRHPSTPIVLLGMIGYHQFHWNFTRYDDAMARRDCVMRHYLACKAAGDGHLHFIDGHGLLAAGETGTSVDGVHPTSAGFLQMAERLAPQLATIRIRERN